MENKPDKKIVSKKENLPESFHVENTNKDGTTELEIFQVGSAYQKLSLEKKAIDVNKVSSTALSSSSKPLGTISQYAKFIKEKKPNIKADTKQKETQSNNKAPKLMFEHLPVVLKAQSFNPGEVYLIQDNLTALYKIIELVKKAESTSLKVGVLFQWDDHTTPFCIEKIATGHSEKSKVCVYHFDSVAMKDKDTLRSLVRNIAKYATIYSLGYEDEDGSILRNYQRQTDDGYCVAYSLYDIQFFLRSGFNFYKFANENSYSHSQAHMVKHKMWDESNRKMSRLWSRQLNTLCKLPAELMATIQSIYSGLLDSNNARRNGLIRFMEAHPFESGRTFDINGAPTNLIKIATELVDEKIRNPILDIMIRSNLDLYEDRKEQFSEDELSDYNLKLARGGSNALYNLDGVKKAILSAADKYSKQLFLSKTASSNEPKVSFEKTIFAMITIVIIPLILAQVIQPIQRQKKTQKWVEKVKLELLEDEDITQDKMADSVFGQGSFTARMLNRANERGNSCMKG